jgi:hypothetical protein
MGMFVKGTSERVPEDASVTLDTEYRPEVGDGATYYVGSDAFPATIVEVKKNGRVVIREDKANLVKGDCAGGEQQWECTSNPEGELEICYKNSKGYWKILGSGRSVQLGIRRRYHDPHF